MHAYVVTSLFPGLSIQIVGHFCICFTRSNVNSGFKRYGMVHFVNGVV